MESEEEISVVVFLQDTVLCDAGERKGSHCKRIGVKKGSYYAKRIKNPMNPNLESTWLVLKGTLIGMVESAMLHTSECWVKASSVVFLFEGGVLEMKRFGVTCERPESVLTFKKATMSKRILQRPRIYAGEPDPEPADNEMFA